MGFYGNLIQKLSNGFKFIGIKNKDDKEISASINAENIEDVVVLSSEDDWIQLTADNSSKEIKINFNEEKILGEGLKETYDTLVEIQNWIEGPGVDATELTKAIADEAKFREEEDDKKVDKTTKINAGDGLAGGGSLAENRTISHAVPTGAESGTTSPSEKQSPKYGGQFTIPVITTDEFGHVTGKGNVEVKLPEVADNAITTNKIAEYAITKTQINAEAVTTQKLATSAVTDEKIADSAVTADKIADSTITEAKLSEALQTKVNQAVSFSDDGHGNIIFSYPTKN